MEKTKKKKKYTRMHALTHTTRTRMRLHVKREQSDWRIRHICSVNEKENKIHSNYMLIQS